MKDHGRLALVANGSRRPKSRWKSALRPFQPLRMSWSGRGSLFSLRAAEPSGAAAPISGMSLMAAYYMNELLMILLHSGDPHADLFTHYGGALASLAGGDDTEPVLRRFEVALLAEIGYGLVIDRDVVDKRPLVAEQKYEYVIDRGPVPVVGRHWWRARVSRVRAAGHESRNISGCGSIKKRQAMLRAVLNRSLGERSL